MQDQHLFWVSFVVCFICFAVRTVYNYWNYRGYSVAAKKPVLIGIYILMGLLWFAWFQMNFTDPVKASLPLWLRILGLVLFVTGVSLFLFAHAGLGRLKQEGKLVTEGIYARIRNPMYLGFILWVVGFPVFMQSMFTLLSAVFWIAHFLIWKALEEKDLLRRFAGYREYMAQTWF